MFMCCKFKLIFVFLLLLFVSGSAYSIDCISVFPTGVQGNNSSSSINIQSGAQINNVPFTELPFSSISNASVSGDSCGSADCSVIGSVAENVTLPTFPTNSATAELTTTNGTVGEGVSSSLNTNSFKEVTINAGTSDFSDNYTEYFIGILNLRNGATLRIKPGNYWIGSLNLSSAGSDGIAVLEVEGTGVVNLFVENNIQANNLSEIRGISATAVINTIVYNNFTLASGAKASGVAYTQGELRLNSNSVFTGTASAGTVDLRADSTVDFTPDLINDFDLTETCEPTLDELLVHYQFNDAIGQTVSDASGFSRDALLGTTSAVESVDPSWKCEARGANLVFDGSAQQQVTAPSFKPPSKGVVAFWMKIPSLPATQERIFGFSGGFQMRLRTNGDLHADLNIRGFQSTVSTSSVISGAELGTWLHFAFVTDITNGNWAIYKNGNLDASGTTTLITQPAAPLLIGASSASASQFFNGELDDFRIYSGELSVAAIEALAASENKPQDCVDELILHYPFDEGSGQSTADLGSLNLDGLLGPTSAENSQDPTWVCEVNGAYLNFNSANNQRVTTDPFQPPGKAVVAFWMNIPSLPSSLNRVFGSGDGFEARLDSSGVIFADVNKAGANTTVRTSGAITDFNTWMHITIMTDVFTGNWAIYINGELDNSGNDSFTIRPEEAFHVGGRATDESSNSFNGSIDDFRIYSGSLTPAEIDALGDLSQAPVECPAIDHYELTYATSAVTCEAATIQIRACEDASCSSVTGQAVSAEVFADDGQIANTTFTGFTSFDYSNTAVETVTLTVPAPSIAAANELRCNGVTASTAGACQLEFVDSTFQFFGANSGDLPPDQLAEANFQDLNLRAVRTNTETGACQASLTGTQTITLGYDCIDPDICLTSFAGATVSGGSAGELSADVLLTFDGAGIASLSTLSYNDAGRIQLSAQSAAHPTINKGFGLVDAYPSYLRLSITDNDLVYNPGTGDPDVYSAGEAFEYTLGAYGAADNLLPNYQAGDLALFLQRDFPTGTGRVDGQLLYNTGLTVTSSADAAAFVSVTNPNFTGGQFTFSNAHYTETGRIILDVRDNDYLGNLISSESDVSLGTFIPAYYFVSVIGSPLLQDAQVNASDDDFTYVGQFTGFASEPSLLVSPRNALDNVTSNYVIEGWVYNPDLAALNTANNVLVEDNSTYTGAASITHENGPDVNAIVASGGRRVRLNGTQLRYDKVNLDEVGSDSNSVSGIMYSPVAPFGADLDLTFSATFLTDINGRCFRQSSVDPDCDSFTISNISGTTLRFGRFVLESNYGAETDDLVVPMRAEYFDGSAWRLNTLDNHTLIDFDEAQGHVILTPIGTPDLTDAINNLDSTGVLQNGLSNTSSDMRFNRPQSIGQLQLSLSPLIDPTVFPYYLNFDWNNDGVICNAATCPDTDDAGSNPQQTDFPSAIVTFGLYRGNDRVIQWREVFN